MQKICRCSLILDAVFLTCFLISVHVCDVHAFAASPWKMAQNRVVAVRVTVEERHLILAGYDLHRNNWHLVVEYVMQHADNNGPIYRQYMTRTPTQQWLTSQLRLLPLCPTSQLRQTLLGITSLCLGESRGGSLCTRSFVRATRPFTITWQTLCRMLRTSFCKLCGSLQITCKERWEGHLEKTTSSLFLLMIWFLWLFVH